MKRRHRRVFGVILIAVAVLIWVGQQPKVTQTTMTTATPPASTTTSAAPSGSTTDTASSAAEKTLATAVLATLDVKGRAPKTGYARTQFGDGWSFVGNCDMRNIILNRDLVSVVVTNTCKVQSGVLNDPYTGTLVNFVRGADTSDVVQIDHVVALSNAWQTGAQLLDLSTRTALANDPLELLAVDGNANQAKSDGDAATWLPANKAFRCQYVARQIAVKAKYKLWVTAAEKSAMAHVLESCPDQTLPMVNG